MSYLLQGHDIVDIMTTSMKYPELLLKQVKWKDCEVIVSINKSGLKRIMG